MDDQISDVEQKHAFYSLGVSALYVWRGARSEGSRLEAFWTTAAAVTGMLSKGDTNDETSD